MAWYSLPVTVEIDEDLRALLVQLTQSTALLTTAIQKTGLTMTSAIEDLASEVSSLSITEQALNAVITRAATAFQEYAARLADLTQQLASIPNNDPQIASLAQQLDEVRIRLDQDASVLQAALPAPQT